MNPFTTFARSSREPAWRAAAPTLFAGAQERPRDEAPCPDAANLAAWTRWAAPRPAPTPTAREAALPLAPWRSGRISRRATDDATDDWDRLFAALTTRLCDSLAGSPAASTELRETVADCMLARTQLQALRARQRGGDRRLEGELRRSGEALAAAHVELLQARMGEQQARHDAQHDSLTALPNRSSFSARLNQVLERADHPTPGLAVLFLDLDGFKPINDRHGHHTGDELLRIVASRLKRSMREQDMVCRLGGDEFACILSGPGGRAQLSQIATQLFDAVSAPLEVVGLRLRVQPSMGIALCPSDGDTAASLLRNADSAMYRAKRGQLGFAFYDRSVDL